MRFHTIRRCPRFRLTFMFILTGAPVRKTLKSHTCVWLNYHVLTYHGRDNFNLCNND